MNIEIFKLYYVSQARSASAIRCNKGKGCIQLGSLDRAKPSERERERERICI
jgi:hypothetical protein